MIATKIGHRSFENRELSKTANFQKTANWQKTANCQKQQIWIATVNMDKNVDGGCGLWMWMVCGRGVDMVDFGFGWSLEEEWMQHSRIRPTWMKKQQYKGFQPVVEVNQLFFCVLNRG